MPANNNIETPVAEDARTSAMLDRLLGEGSEDEILAPQEEPAIEEDASEVEDDVEESEGEDDSSNEDGPPDEDAEEDYETPVKKKTAPGDEEVDLDKAPESIARKMAKENGQKVKQLNVQLEEKDLELSREREEREKIQSQLEELRTVRLDPSQHPDYLKLRDEVLSDTRNVARRLPGRAKVLLTQNQNLGILMREYLTMTEAEGEDILTADSNLHNVIATTLELSETPYEDLDPDEQAGLKPTIDKVIDVLERNAPKTKQLLQLQETLAAKAKAGQLAVGVREYEVAMAEFSPIIDAIGDLPDEVLEASPNTVESFVARMVKESPEAAKRLKAAKRDALEAILGPRPLTQDEIDKLEKNGTDVRGFLSQRDKQHIEKRKKLVGMFVQALMTRSEFASVLTELHELREKNKSKDTEYDTLQKVAKKKPVSEDGPKKKRRDPLHFLGDDEY